MKRFLSLFFIAVCLPCWAQTIIDLDTYNAEPTVKVEPSVSVSLLVMKISQEIGSDWGLDGGPAVNPKSTPLGHDIPKLLKPSKARKLITALRKQAGSEIIGSKTLVVEQGQEGFGAGVGEGRFQILNRKFILKGENGEIYTPHAIRDEFFEDPIGVSFTANVDTVTGDDRLYLDLHPKIAVAARTAGKDPRPVLTALESRAIVEIPSGFTIILMCGHPSPKGDSLQIANNIILDRRPYIMFVTAKIIHDHKPEPEK